MVGMDNAEVFFVGSMLPVTSLLALLLMFWRAEKIDQGEVSRRDRLLRTFFAVFGGVALALILWGYPDHWYLVVTAFLVLIVTAVHEFMRSESAAYASKADRCRLSAKAVAIGGIVAVLVSIVGKSLDTGEAGGLWDLLLRIESTAIFVGLLYLVLERTRPAVEADRPNEP